MDISSLRDALKSSSIEGEKISPIEIDDVLLRHPAVVEAVAFAVPSKVYGEDVHAAVVLKSPTDEKELKKYCSEFFSRF